MIVVAGMSCIEAARHTGVHTDVELQDSQLKRGETARDSARPVQSILPVSSSALFKYESQPPGPNFPFTAIIVLALSPSPWENALHCFFV